MRRRACFPKHAYIHVLLHSRYGEALLSGVLVQFWSHTRGGYEYTLIFVRVCTCSDASICACIIYRCLYTSYSENLAFTLQPHPVIPATALLLYRLLHYLVIPATALLLHVDIYPAIVHAFLNAMTCHGIDLHVPRQ